MHVKTAASYLLAEFGRNNNGFIKTKMQINSSSQLPLVLRQLCSLRLGLEKLEMKINSQFKHTILSEKMFNISVTGDQILIFSLSHQSFNILIKPDDINTSSSVKCM